MDAQKVCNQLVSWLTGQVQSANARGVVLGLSGGIDSAVVAALCKRAFPDTSLGLVMPCHSNPQDMEDARLVADTLGLDVTTVDLSPIYDALIRLFTDATGGSANTPTQPDPARLDLAKANIKPRLRMITLYHFANRLNYLVVGTGNRSELTVGYFTKYGDGGVDLLPIAGLVKGQVRELARYLGIPERIITKPPSAGLWAGQTDEHEMGLTYEDLDRYILTGKAAPEVAHRVEELKAKARHKTAMPAVPELTME